MSTSTPAPDLIARARLRVAELRAALRDPERPLPPVVWAVLALLVSASFFLALRLVVLRGAPAAATATTPPPAVHTVVTSAARAVPAAPVAATAAPSGRAEAPPPPPPSSPEAFASLVEGWRRAWVTKDVRAYLAYYAQTFGSQGKDLQAWTDYKTRVFAGPAPIEVELSDVQVTIGASVAILQFVQVYRSEGYEDRGRKRLYLLDEKGQWRIFNEEWEPLG